MILGDFGTSYSKFLDLSAPSPEPYIVPSKKLSAANRVAIATGHNGRRFTERYVNELTVLARGGAARPLWGLGPRITSRNRVFCTA